MERNTGEEPRDGLVKVLAFTLTAAVMSATMFNIVLADIREEYRLGFAGVSWISSSYLLVYAIGSVMYGKLADRYPLRNVVTAGILIMAAGSLIGLFSGTYGMLLLGRVVQAAGAAVIPALAGIIPIRYYPPERRGQVIGTLVSGLALGGAVGPVVSALVVSVLPYRWLFCIPLAVLAALPYYRKRLRGTPAAGGAIDWLGGSLLAAAIALLLLAFTYGSWAAGAGCVVAVLLFLLRIRAAETPFVDSALFRNGRYTAGIGLASLVTIVVYALPFLTPLLLAQVYGLPAGLIGLAMVPGTVASAVLGRRAGKLADKKGNAALFYTASLLLLAAYALLSAAAGEPAYWVIGCLLLGSVGQSFLMIAVSHTIAGTLPQEQAGIGTGLQSMVQFAAGSVAAGAYGKAADLQPERIWNPWNGNEDAAVYSNIYVALAAAAAVIVLLYAWRFGKASAGQPYRSSRSITNGERVTGE